jgi:hypothetical protein
VSTAEPEKPLALPPEDEPPEPEGPRLLLVKSEPEPEAPDQDEDQDQPEDAPVEEDQEDEEDQEEEPGLLHRTWYWIGEQWREIIGPLEIRRFIIETVEDLAVSTKYLPRLAYYWITAPDVKEEGGLAKLGIRAALVIGPTVGTAYFALQPGKEFIVPMVGCGLIVASWMFADDARDDARLRKIAKAKKSKNAERKRLVAKAARYGLDPEDVAEFLAKEKGEQGKDDEARPKISLEKEPVEEEPEEGDEPVAWTKEDVDRYVWGWVLEQIGDKNGIHLADLLKAAREKKDAPQLVTPQTKSSDFADALVYRQIKVGQVKVNGRNLTGVKKSDVPRA